MGFIEDLERKKKHLQEVEGNRIILDMQQKSKQEKMEKGMASLKEEHMNDLLMQEENSEKKYNESGIPQMLGRLTGIGEIERVYQEHFCLPGENLLFGKKDGENHDGRYHTKVIVNSEDKRINPGSSYYCYTGNYFNIITVSTGTIVFEYGRIFRHHLQIEQYEWQGRPTRLEDALHKSFKSPIRERSVYKPYYGPPNEVAGQ